MKEKCEVAILAGGLGTRLGKLSASLPKPMVPIGGVPLLAHQIELCRKHRFFNIALLVHHRYEKITDFFGDGGNFGVSLKYAIEKKPRGTAGALHDSLPILADHFLVLYGDTFIDVNLRKLWVFHHDYGASSTLFLHPNNHPEDSDIVEIDVNRKVQAILPYPRPKEQKNRNLVNAALCVMANKGLREVSPATGKADIAKDMFPKMLKAGKLLCGYVSPEYIKDAGTPERLEMVEKDFTDGLPERLSGRRLRTAVFLDRDGTLNKEVNHLSSPEQIELLPGVGQAVSCLNRAGKLAVVVTNQPVLARGNITLEDLNQVHAHLDAKLGNEGAYLDGLYFCPHHPDKGFSGEIVELKKKCLCRKPEPGLIEQACRELEISRNGSWMVGDSTADIEAGRRAGVRTILLRTGHCGNDFKYPVRPDYVFPNLEEAIDWILKGHARMTSEFVKVATNLMNNKRVVLIGGLARAGKSIAAQVLKEILELFGQCAHLISLDGWLKPKELRQEGSGVLDRYNMHAISTLLQETANAKSRILFHEPIYDRLNRIHCDFKIEHSIGPTDILLVEGVPALLMDELMVSSENTSSVYVEVDPLIRSQRLSQDYGWRNNNDDYLKVLESREIDESPIIIQSKARADFVV